MAHLSEPALLHRSPAFQALKTYLIELTGLGYYHDKDGTLALHVQRHLTRLNISNLAQYLDLIRSPEGQEDLDYLLDDIAIGETYFFRNTAQFDALQYDILPERIANARNRGTLKIWSAGCASGAEPYSISILLSRMSPALKAIDILGTDICGRRLKRARSAVFSEWELRGLPDELRRDCFTRQGKLWNLNAQFVRGVTFRQQNLMDILTGPAEDAGGQFDIILCRNVLIYFDMDLMRRILARLRDLLVDGGWLLVGHSEPFLEIAHFLTPVSVSGTTAYRRCDGADGETLSTFTPPLVWTAPPVNFPGVPSAPPPPPAMLPNFPETPGFSVGANNAPVNYEIPPPPEPAVDPRTQVKGRDALDEVHKLADAGDWRKAMDSCTAYIADNQLDPAGHFLLALILEHQGQGAAAFEALKRVVYLDRGHALAHFHLGRMHAMTGDAKQAKRSFSNARDLVSRMPLGTPLAGGDGLVNDELGTLVHQHLARLEG
ncbi:MAG: protein-glutamate O-methyltransferase CheR [Alphaproteobacteria bacterium]|uniref:CheR family methyltransferase n=1 Tax=Nisaea sp. TaxID=2024842 RepID=UPI0032637DA0